MFGNKVIKIHGEYLLHKRFTDDVLLLNENLEVLTTMAKTLSEDSGIVGLKMHKN